MTTVLQVAFDSAGDNRLLVYCDRPLTDGAWITNRHGINGMTDLKPRTRQKFGEMEALGLVHKHYSSVVFPSYLSVSTFGKENQAKERVIEMLATRFQVAPENVQVVQRTKPFIGCHADVYVGDRQSSTLRNFTFYFGKPLSADQVRKLAQSSGVGKNPDIKATFWRDYIYASTSDKAIAKCRAGGRLDFQAFGELRAGLIAQVVTELRVFGYTSFKDVYVY